MRRATRRGRRSEEIDFKLVVGARLVFADATPDIIAYPATRHGWGPHRQGHAGVSRQGPGSKRSGPTFDACAGGATVAARRTMSLRHFHGCYRQDWALPVRQLGPVGLMRTSADMPSPSWRRRIISIDRPRCPFNTSDTRARLPI